MTLITVDAQMSYVDEPRPGMALVFLHGFPNNHLLWKHQVEAWSNHFHIVNFNLPGSDASSNQPTPISLKQIQQTLIQTIHSIAEREPGKQFVFIGHDLGCFLLADVARAIPQHVAGQIFIGGMSLQQFAARLSWARQWLKSFYVVLLQLPFFAAFVKHALQRLVIRYTYSVSNIATDASLATEAPGGFNPIGLYRALAKQLKSVRRNTGPRSPVPTLFIFGASDRFLIPPTQNEVDGFYERGQVAVVDGGHWLVREQPSAVNSLCSTFLNQLSGMP